MNKKDRIESESEHNIQSETVPAPTENRVSRVLRLIREECGEFFLNFFDTDEQYKKRAADKTGKACRKYVLHRRIAIGGTIFAGVGVSALVISYSTSPEYQQQLAQEAEEAKHREAQAQELIERAFTHSELLGENLYAIDLNLIHKAYGLVSQNAATSATPPHWLTSTIEGHFHLFKEVHPELEVLGIVEPTDIDNYKGFIDASNRLIIITRQKE